MKHTAFLLIDVQTAMIENHPYEYPAFLEKAQTLLNFCRSHGIEVIYIRHDDGPGTDLEMESPGWQIYSVVAPLKGERIFDKRFNSAFHRTGLRDYLRKRKIDTLILAGLQTEYCIDTTCKVAFEYGYHVIIPKGSTTTFDTPTISGQQLCDFYENRVWNRRFAYIVPLEELLPLLEKE